jgi:hypothetical protein
MQQSILIAIKKLFLSLYESKKVKLLSSYKNLLPEHVALLKGSPLLQKQRVWERK